MNNDTLRINAKTQNNIPLKIIYRKKVPRDAKFKRFAIVKDLTGREYTHGAIHVNADSVSCFYGDMECFGIYKSIDSIKVSIGGYGASDWIRLHPKKRIIQIILKTQMDLNEYQPLDMKFVSENGMLKWVD
jgi:hypothetical protein